MSCWFYSLYFAVLPFEKLREKNERRKGGEVDKWNGGCYKMIVFPHFKCSMITAYRIGKKDFYQLHIQ